MIFVTGGTGFLGRHLVPGLCRAGYAMRVLTRRPQENQWLHRYPQVEVVQGDLRNGEQIAELVQGCRYVIHAAGLFSLWGPPQDFAETNVKGTDHIACAALRAGVQRMVYVSTAAVIGRPDPDGIVDELHPARPADPYQLSKLQAEQHLLQYHSSDGLPVIILRPGAYYGPLGDYAFNRLFFTDPMRGITMQINGGRYIIFPAYIADVVQGIINALELGRSGEIYNISGEWISHRAAFDIIYEAAGLRWPRLTIPGWLALNFSRLLTGFSTITRREPFWPLNLRSYVFNNWRVSSEKARRELNFRPTPFRDGAYRTVAWYRDGRPDDLPELECTPPET